MKKLLFLFSMSTFFAVGMEENSNKKLRYFNNGLKCPLTLQVAPCRYDKELISLDFNEKDTYTLDSGETIGVEFSHVPEYPYLGYAAKIEGKKRLLAHDLPLPLPRLQSLLIQFTENKSCQSGIDTAVDSEDLLIEKATCKMRNKPYVLNSFYMKNAHPVGGKFKKILQFIRNLLPEPLIIKGVFFDMGDKTKKKLEFYYELKPTKTINLLYDNNYTLQYRVVGKQFAQYLVLAEQYTMPSYPCVVECGGSSKRPQAEYSTKKKLKTATANTHLNRSLMVYEVINQ